MSCGDDTFSTKVYPVEKIAEYAPDAIPKSMSILNGQPCRLKSGGYCTKSQCYLDKKPPSSIPLTCTCSMYTILSNMFFEMYNSTYCVITNQSNTIFTLVNQEVRFTIIQDDGKSIENVNLTINQTADVFIVSLTSTTVQQDIVNKCFQVIENVIDQSELNPEYFDDPASKAITESFRNYDMKSLQEIIQVSVTSTIQSMTTVNQQINVVIRNSTWKSLEANFSQEAVVSIVAENIANTSISNITEEILGDQMENLSFMIRDTYCKQPSKVYYLLPLIFLLLFPLYFAIKRY